MLIAALFSVCGCSVLSDYKTLCVRQVIDLGNQSKKNYILPSKKVDRLIA